MGRLSRGCLRCRERRVRCDEGKPSCERCLKRNDICEGYRDDLVFRHETTKIIENTRARGSFASGSSASSLRRSRSVGASSDASRGRLSSTRTNHKFSEPDTENLLNAAQFARPPRPWLKDQTKPSQSSLGDLAVDHFFEKYVFYPCHESSTPGFLEHLPCLFKEVNVEGRCALRWAVQAAALADLSSSSDDAGDDRKVLVQRALDYYGKALSSLGSSLAEPNKMPDDFDLMTVVVLDLFETLFLHDTAGKGAHAQGMAQILRLRGTDQVHNPRGWSLFRLAHHRIQKQQLALGMPQIPESKIWLDQLNEGVSHIRIEKDAFEIKKTCSRAQDLLDLVTSWNLPPSELVAMAREMLTLDQKAAEWRNVPEWHFRTIRACDVIGVEIIPSHAVLPEMIELHGDIWSAYEWNYHRTARIIFHQQIIRCLETALASPESAISTEASTSLSDMIDGSLKIVAGLANGVLASVPQSFGDLDRLGRVHDSSKGLPRCRAIGAYLLLWPIKVIVSQSASTEPDQKVRARAVFEKIREYTGMKSVLGDLSCL